MGKNAFGKYRELGGFVLQFISKILCKKTAHTIQESHSLGNLTVASSCQFHFKLVCVPEVQLWPFKSTSNKCFKPIVLQLLEGKAVQHDGDPLELCSKACSVFGTAPVVSLAHQTVLMQTATLSWNPHATHQQAGNIQKALTRLWRRIWHTSEKTRG